MKELKELFPYQKINTRCIYYDKKFDDGGIDYTKFIKLKDDVEKYTPNEWYLMWYLMSKGFYNDYYLETSIGFIMTYTKLNIDQIKENLISLQNKKVILYKGEVEKLKRNDVLELVIGYNLDEYYNSGTNKFKRIPKDFISVVLSKVNANEWYLYCILALYYSFEDGYAYPTIEKLEKRYGLADKTIIKSIKALKEHKYNLIEVEKTTYNKGNFPNNRYTIRLFQREEYMFHHVINKEDKSSKAYHKQSREFYQNNKRNYILK